MSEKNFLRLFPQEEGYRLFLIEAPSAQAGKVFRAIPGTESRAEEERGVSLAASVCPPNDRHQALVGRHLE